LAEKQGTIERAAEGLAMALLPLEELLAPENLPFLLVELGLDKAVALGPDAALEKAIADAIARLLELPSEIQVLADAVSANDTGKIIESAAKLIEIVARFALSIDQMAKEIKRITAGSAVADEVVALGGVIVERLVGAAIIRYLELEHRAILHALILLGLAETNEIDVDWNGEKERVRRRALKLEQLGDLFKDPLAFIGKTYGWGTEALNEKLLFQRVNDVLLAMGILAGNDDPTVEDEGASGIDLFQIAFRKTQDHPPGIVGSLVVALTDTLTFTLVTFDDSWRLDLSLTAALSEGIEIRLLPPLNLHLVPPAGTVEGDATLAIIGEAPKADEKLILFRMAESSRLEAKRVQLGFLAGAKWQLPSGPASADVGFEAKVVEGKFVIDTSNSDGFLKKVLPEGGFSFDFDFTLGWSNQRGVYFSGGAALEVTLPLHLSLLGVIEVDSLNVILGIDKDALKLALGTNVEVTIGPVAASIEKMGLALNLAFKRGNLGNVDLGVGFKPPSGIGIVVDAGPVSGGGFISFDFDNQRYAGVLQLKLYSIGITAIALLDTKLPGGQPGFSFLIIITIDFTPIQIGFGFTLNGVGGMAGINRTMKNPGAARRPSQSRARRHSLSQRSGQARAATDQRPACDLPPGGRPLCLRPHAQAGLGHFC